MKTWLPMITTRRVAAAMVGLAVVGGLIDWLVGARAWMPNVVVGALTVAITITVVERALRNEQRVRDQPIVDVITTRADLQLMGFIYTLLGDYSITHLNTFKAVPETLVGLCDLWLDGSEDAPRPEYPVGTYPPVLTDARALSDHLNTVRAQYGFVVEKSPVLIDAIERLSEWVAQASAWHDRAKLGFPSPSAALQATLLKRVVEATRNFAEVFGKETGHEIRLSQEQRAAAEQWNREGRERALQHATSEQPGSTGPTPIG